MLYDFMENRKKNSINKKEMHVEKRKNEKK